LALWFQYPNARVTVEDPGPSGRADGTLYTEERVPWIRAELKKDDALLQTPDGRKGLWNDKRKYATGLTRLIVFVTPHYVWLVDPSVPSPWEAPVSPGTPTVSSVNILADLTAMSAGDLQALVVPWIGPQARHDRQWEIFLDGELPYAWLSVNDHQADWATRLQHDLAEGFGDLSDALGRVLVELRQQHDAYRAACVRLEGQGLKAEASRRARRRLTRQYHLALTVFEEALPLFDDLYGRSLEGSSTSSAYQARIQEAFVVDSVAVLITRVLFLRLLEDTHITSTRRLSNGGPRRWKEFVNALVHDAQALVDVAYRDAAATVPVLLTGEFFFNGFLCDNQNNLVGLIKPGDRLVVQPLVQTIFGTHYDCLMAIRQPHAHQVGN